MKKLMFLMFGLLAIVSCKDDDNDGPASKEQYEEANGQWYAEIPISGTTANWRTEEEGDSTTYDHVAALIFLNGYTTAASYWCYIFVQDGELVNFDGFGSRDEEANFDFTMDKAGNITTSSHLSNAPEVSNMHYADSILTADVAYKDRTLHLTFTRPKQTDVPTLSEYWAILQEEGIVGGSTDMNGDFLTEITDKNATESSRAK